jgi:hypothetical protein
MVDKTTSRFRQMVGKMPVADIQRKQVIAFKNALLASWQTVVNTDKQLTMLRTMVAYAMNQGWILADPSKGVRVGERRNAEAASVSRSACPH